jgi:NADH-quinone oxidoreductase subunit M
MLSHGIISGALFLIVGVVYDRMHSRDIARYGGLVHRMPLYALFFMVFMLGSVGLPGTSGFVGEFLVLVGVFQVNTWVALLASTGIILGAAYMLWLYRRVIFGRLTRDDLKDILDLSPREIAMFVPLLAMTLWMGIYPAPFLAVMDGAVTGLVDQHKAAMAAIQSLSVAGR